MARLHDVVFDCHRPSAVARFWAEALDGYDIAPYDDDEIGRLQGRSATSSACREVFDVKTHRQALRIRV